MALRTWIQARPGPWRALDSSDTPCPRVSSGRREPELAGTVSSGGSARTGHFPRFQVSPRIARTGTDGKQLFSAVSRHFRLFPGFRQNQAALAYTSDGTD